MFRKNVAGQGLGFTLINASTGAPFPGATVSVQVVIDGGTPAGGAGSVQDKGGGQYWYFLAQAETNGNDVSVLFSASGAISVEKTFITTAADPTDGLAFGLADIPAIKAKTDLIGTDDDSTGGGTPETPPDPLDDPANFIDASDNYLIWVNPITGTYITRGYDQRLIPLAPVYNRHPTTAEMAASNGAYTRIDRVWLIPKAIFPGGFPRPKPGDWILDDDGVKWTVLERALKALKSTYWFMTRDLVLAHQLYDLIDIQRPQITYDEAGAIVRDWPDGTGPSGSPAGVVLYKQIPAKVQLITQESVFTLGISGLKGNYVAYVGEDVNLLKGDRLVWYRPQGVTYLDVMGQHDPQRIDMLPVLDCQQLP